MTFDFAPDWLETLSHPGQFSAAAPASRVSPLLPQPVALPCPSAEKLAALVGELFAEGTLSWEQLRSLVALPELGPHLRPALATVTAGRKLHAAGR